MRVIVDWGDGTQSTSDWVDPGTRVEFRHTWPKPGAQLPQEYKALTQLFSSLFEKLLIKSASASPGLIYEVTAKAEDEEGDTSEPSQAHKVHFPAPPTGLEITSNGCTQDGKPKIDFKWNAVSDARGGYSIHIADNAFNCPSAIKDMGDNTTFSWSESTPVNTIPAGGLCSGQQDTTPQPDKTYWWEVFSLDPSGGWGPSQRISFKTQRCVIITGDVCPKVGWTGNATNPPQVVLDAASQGTTDCAKCWIKMLAYAESGYHWNAFGSQNDRGMWQYIWSTWRNISTIDDTWNVCSSPVSGVDAAGREVCKDADVKVGEPDDPQSMWCHPELEEDYDQGIWDPVLQASHVVNAINKGDYSPWHSWPVMQKACGCTPP